MDVAGIREITEAIDKFARGETMHFETMIAEGVYFDFDCTFEQDLMEPQIPVAVGIQEWSPHNHGEPEEHRLMDYSEKMDEVTCGLDEAFYNAGSRNRELVFEYSKPNSNPEKGHYVFFGDIHNPRVAVTMDGIEVTEEYA